MKKTQSQTTIEPNEPQSKSTQLKMIQNLVKNKYLNRKNKIQTIQSMKKSVDDEDGNIKVLQNRLKYVQSMNNDDTTNDV